MMEAIATKIELAELIDGLTPSEEVADKLNRLDAILIRGEQIDCPLEHQFVDGMYMRERFVPAGTLFTTYTWIHEHPFFHSMGELLIYDVKSASWRHHIAPSHGITQAGTKRIVYALTDIVWTTCHVNKHNIQDIEELEGYLLEKYDNPYLSLPELKAIQK